MVPARFKPIYHALVLAPLAVYVLTFLSNLFLVDFGGSQGLNRLLEPLSGIGVLVAYFHQVKYLRANVARNSLKRQLALILAAIIIPAVGFVVGDIHGLAEFGENAVAGTPLIASVFIGLFVGLVALWLCAVGNMITILTGGRHSVLRTLGFVAHGLMACAIAFVAYVAYGLAYSLRDPSTE